MRLLTTLGLVAVSAAVLADGAADRLAAMEQKVDKVIKARRTLAEIENSPEVLAKTGGFIDVPARGTAIVVIDARAQAGGAPEQFAEVFGNLSKMLVKVEKAPLPKGQRADRTAFDARARHGAVFALSVEDGDAERPGLAVYPEDRVVVVNAARYRSGDDPIQREVRIVKELWRGLGYVSGIGYPGFKNDVFQPIDTVQELDAMEYQVMQPMNFQKMYAFMRERGVVRSRHLPYRVACHEGWAPAPTNEIQKAIWDQVREIPKNPIKITFDPKTDSQ